MLIRIDRDRCVGAGSCVMKAADVFDQDARDGLVVLLVAQPEAAARARVEAAIAACPSQAIWIEE